MKKDPKSFFNFGKTISRCLFMARHEL